MTGGRLGKGLVPLRIVINFFYFLEEMLIYARKQSLVGKSPGILIDSRSEWDFNIKRRV